MKKNNNDTKRYFSKEKSNVLSNLKSKKPNAPDFVSDPKITAYINEQVQGGLKAALRGASPKANTTNATEQEQAKFNKMTYKERLNLFNSNPQAYNKLSKGAKE